jgi:two-component system cell cycle sensor histidine kinase/response regulator CckA
LRETAVAMVVDDDSLVRRTVAAVLERHNFTVLQAEGVAEAVRIAAEHHGDIDLLIANHSLADGTGRDAAERITQAWPDVKVLQYSGYSR